MSYNEGEPTVSETVSEERKQSLRTAFTNAVSQAVAFDKILGIESSGWEFTMDGSAELIGDDGKVAERLAILPMESDESTRTMVTIVTRQGLDPEDRLQDHYRIIFRKNTQEVVSVAKATIGIEDIDAVHEVAGVEEDAVVMGALAFSLAGVVTEDLQRSAEFGHMATEAKWNLGECTNPEIDDLVRALEHSNPSSDRLL